MKGSEGVLLVGRGPELVRLRSALTRAAAGRPDVVLVAGEAGVGKSRLVEAMLAEAHPEPLVLRSHGVDLGDPGLPSLAVLDLVRGLRSAGAEVPDLADRVQVYDAVVTALGEVSASRPVVVVAEDVQWYDAASADLLRFLASRLTGERLLLVVTVRTDGIAGRPTARRLVGDLGRLPAVERIDLEPFTGDEVADYLARAGVHVPADAVLERTGGNPLYVATLIAAREPLGDRLPRGLTDLLVGRVDRLTEPSRAAVHAASVAPYAVPDRVLRRALEAAGIDDVDAALREAVAEGVLRTEGDGYAFSHEVLRRAVHDDLLPGERSRWHEALADALDSGGGGGWATEIAHHAEQAGDLPRSLAWSRRAADEAERVLASGEALRQLQRVLAHEPEGALAVRAARAAGLAGEPEHAVEWARRAVTLHDGEGGTEGRVRARAELARQLLAVDRGEQAVPPATEAVELAAATEVDAATRALAHLLLARALVGGRRPDEARPHADQALTTAREAGRADLEAETLTTLALLDEIAGDRPAAAAQLGSAIRLARDAGVPAAELRAHNGLAGLHFYNGDVAGALPVLRTALDRVAEVGLRWSTHGVELRLLLAISQYAAGDLDASLATVGPTAGRPPDVAAARLAAVGCYAAVARGGPEAATRTASLADSWDLDPQVALVAGGCEADRLTWEAEPEAAVLAAARAQAHLDAAVGEGMYGGLWLSALGLAALADLATTARLQRDRTAEAEAVRRGEDLLGHVESLAATGRGRPGALGPEGAAWVLRARAESARLAGDPAVEQWQAAYDAFGYGHRYEQARCGWRLAEACVADHDRAAARTHAEAAAAEAERMGARPLAAAVAALQQRARLTTGDAPTVLTGREREVLALVAEGLTNREIGRRLFISEKTASVHLSNLMAKLDVSSRTEAVTVAHRRGLLDVL